MINEDLALNLIRRAEQLGASYVETRFEESEEEGAIVKNREVDAVGYSRASGVGIRVVYRGALGFSSTNDLSEASLMKMLDTAISMAKAASIRIKNPVRVAQIESVSAKWASERKQNPFSVPMEEKINELLALDDYATYADVTFPARVFSIGFNEKRKLIVNSYGDKVESDVLRAEGFIFLTAYNPQKGSIQKYDQLGEASGWEAVAKWDLRNRTKELANVLSDNLMKGTLPETGEKDVVLGSEVSGIVVHESAGHPAEADRILGREAAQAGESYLKPTSLGLKIGSDKVNVIDDPTLPHSYGYYLYDDEGVKARPRYLIKDGIINEFLHNRETASLLGAQPNGAARASAFDREPMVRMANTYFAPGDQSLDELVEGISDGVYIKSFMEWNIDDVRWNERYVGLEAYSIKNGKIEEPLKAPVLEITTGKLYSSVDAVSRNLAFNAATCGKGEPSQGVPVWTGGAEVRLRRVRISKR
ncbi:MAG TPA: TldD/PmbA family protein [Thermoprotei archaeon]|nr:TldD/PmbA family protein [TACK group archaeon]HEV51194.1 TldD/PmbA family protein [Thermoprotei archaeon]